MPRCEIVPAYILRPAHVAFALGLVFLLFPMHKRFRHRLMWWDVIFAMISVGIIGYILYWGDELGDRATVPSRSTSCVGVALIVLILEGCRRSSTWILPFICALFICYALFGPYLPSPWTHKGYEIAARRLAVHDARRHLRHGGRRVVDADHPVHDLRRGAAVFGRRQILHRFFVRRDGREAFERGPRGGAGLVPARRAVGVGRGDDRDARLGRVAATAAIGLRQGSRGRPARGRGAGRDSVAAGARRGCFPYRRIPQDLVPRRHSDGDDPDDPVLSRAFSSWSRSTRASSTWRRSCSTSTSARCVLAQAILVSVRVADRDRRVHAARLFAGAVGVLGDGRHGAAVIHASRHGDHSLRCHQGGSRSCEASGARA